MIRKTNCTMEVLFDEKVEMPGELILNTEESTLTFEPMGIGENHTKTFVIDKISDVLFKKGLFNDTIQFQYHSEDIVITNFKDNDYITIYAAINSISNDLMD